jgi:coenzyme F420 hydrogenase subunit beta
MREGISMTEGFDELKKNVIDRGLCTACGTCVGVCPVGVLQVTHVEGEPEPELVGECTQCGLCLEVCGGASIPLADMDRWLFGKESSFKSDPLGIYRKCLRGYATDPRVRGTSTTGGATTAILTYALEKGIIEAAILVGWDEQRPWRCSPILITHPEEIKKATRFSTEMVSVNSLLSAAVIERGYKKIGVVGLPCHIHSLRKIQMAGRPPKIARALKLTLGLFCAATYYYEGVRHLLSEFAGIEQPDDIIAMDYRGGPWPGAFMVTTQDRRIHHILSKHEYTWHFLGPASKRDRCLMCPDFSARVADIALGDIFQKVTPNPNTNAILVRTETGEEITLGAVNAGLLATEPHPPELIPKSGMGWEAKEHAGIHRMKFRKRYGWPLPDYQYALEICPLPGKLVFPG